MTIASADRLRDAVARLAPEVRARVREDEGRWPCERSLWREMACCVLSSSVPYELALSAAQRIDQTEVLLLPLETGYDQVRAHLLELLSAPLAVGDQTRRYRFPQSRSAQLTAAWQVIREQRGSLAAAVGCQADPRATRAWLVRQVPGLGPKQASMFLRNIGVTYDLAVIDRHVARYMLLIGLCDSIPAALGSLSVYGAQESILRRHALDLGYTVGVVDWAIWIVMRVATLGRA